jgi:hypothetical protein
MALKILMISFGVLKVLLMKRCAVCIYYMNSGHLNYGGRGNKNRKDDAHFNMTRAAMDLAVRDLL